MKKLTVVHAKVGEELEIKTVEHTLDEVQKLVGGWMETVRLADDLLLIVNEEGKIQDLPNNFATVVVEDNVPMHVDTIAGDAFFVSVLGSDFHSLDKEQIQRVKKMFRADRQICIVAVR